MSYSKESYDWYKAHGFCVYCQKERAEPGKTMCFSCLEKRNKKLKQYIKEHPDYKEEAHKRDKARYTRLKEAGLCVKCGKKPGVMKNGKRQTLCNTCRLKHRRRDQERSITKYRYYRERGLCIKCGGERLEGRIICKDCLKKYQELAERNFSPHRAENAERLKKLYDL